MFNITARAKQAIARASAASNAPRRLRRRVRFVERDHKMIAQVDELRGLKWVPTEVIEEIDLGRMALAVRKADAINGDTAGFAPDDTAGFWKKVKKVAKKVAKNKVVKVIAKAHTVPLKAAHKITHGKNSPIRKAELAMQKTIAKNLPIAKPFIAVHNKLAGATHKVIEGKGVKAAAKGAKPSAAEITALAETNRRVKADAITKALKKVPKDQQDEVRKALVEKATSWIVISPKTGLTHTLKL